MVRYITESGTATTTEATVELDYHPIAIKVFNDDATNDLKFQVGHSTDNDFVLVGEGEETGWLECPSNKEVYVVSLVDDVDYRIVYKTM